MIESQSSMMEKLSVATLDHLRWRWSGHLQVPLMHCKQRYINIRDKAIQFNKTIYLPYSMHARNLHENKMKYLPCLPDT